MPLKNSSMRNALFYVIGLVGCTMLMQSCFEEEFTMSGDAIVEFSTDSLRFDTVFTELGSATRSFRVRNNNDLSVRISNVRLEDEQSPFRINVDGTLGPSVDNLEILPGDSAWVFVEVTIDPDADVSASPFVIEDYVVFELNGNTQRVLLEAFGQNANYIPGRDQGNGIALLTCDLDEVVWDDPKPYVIYGTLVIDSCTLIWPAGTQVYVHGGIADNQLGVFNDGILFTLPDGRIVSRGTIEDPVIVRDDRLEEEYTGIWGGIRFGPLSGPHFLKNTQVSNAVTAIGVDSAARLNLENVVINGSAGSGLFARAAQLVAVNSLFFDNNGAAVALTYGGDYTMEYCTIESSGNDGEGLVINDFFCSDPLCSQGAIVRDIRARVRNTIIVGSSRDEVSLTNLGRDLPQIDFDVRMTNCVVRVDELLDEERFPDFFTDICTECIDYELGDTLFVNPEMFDFHLDTASIAEEMALPRAGIIVDLDGASRDPFAPDIGCYEFQD